MDHYTITLARELARQNGLILSDRHLEVLEYVDDYYARHRVGPLFKNITNATGASRREIVNIFPHGLASVFAWAGIPIHTPDQICKSIPKVAVKNPRHVYFDYSATTPLRPEIVTLLMQYNESDTAFANPSSGSIQGKKAHGRIEKARKQIASLLSVNADTISFTGGGSEANNLAIKGFALSHWENKGHIITSQIAHSSVLEPVRWLESQGFPVTYLAPDADGRIMAANVESAIRKDTIFVSLLAANNEIGVLNPIAEIGELCWKKDIAFHVDAIQAFTKIPLDPVKMNVDIMTFSGHKIYGPKGVGAIYISSSVHLTPLIHGGGQEHGIRSGTENVGCIAAFALASKIALEKKIVENERLQLLRDYLLAQIRIIEPGVKLNGHASQRLPHHLSLSFPGVTSGGLLLALEEIGISVSAGSACSAGQEEGSHVLRALGVDGSKNGTIRITLGIYTKKDDIEYFLKYLPLVLTALRQTV